MRTPRLLTKGPQTVIAAEGVQQSMHFAVLGLSQASALQQRNAFCVGAEVTCNRASIPRTWGCSRGGISVSGSRQLKACVKITMAPLGRVRAAVVLTAYWAAVSHAGSPEQPRAAICFFGLTRSLAYTIESIRSSVFDPLILNGIDYSVFVHTYSVSVVCRAASRRCIPCQGIFEEFR